MNNIDAVIIFKNDAPDLGAIAPAINASLEMGVPIHDSKGDFVLAAQKSDGAGEMTFVSTKNAKDCLKAVGSIRLSSDFIDAARIFLALDESVDLGAVPVRHAKPSMGMGAF